MRQLCWSTNSYRLDVCPSVTRWYCIKTAEHIFMLSSPHDSPFILVLCVSRYSRNSDGVTPFGGAKQRWGMTKPAIFQKDGASINRLIQRAINLVRLSTAINTLATAVRVSTVYSHFQSNEHWKVEYEHPFSRASAAQQLKACLSYPNSVRPFVCLSHAVIVSKRLNILSWFFHHTIAHSF